MKNWVDFRAVKAAVSIAMALERYQITNLKGVGDSRRGPCPIHGGGESFTVNLKKNAFHCWSCKAKGNVLDLVAALEKTTVRQAAERLAEAFSIDLSTPTTEPTPAEVVTQPAENKPLTFALRGINPRHPYLAQRGIEQGIAVYFGAGFFPGKGSMSRRVVIPIHNEAEELVAYAGRAIDDSEPRYKLPAGFHKTLVLFNQHRARRAADVGGGRVIVVEGFFDCMKVAQAGFLNVVALMGSSLSEAQAGLLAGFREVVLMLDGDDAGRTASDRLAGELARRTFVRVVTVAGQPDLLPTEEIRRLLAV